MDLEFQVLAFGPCLLSVFHSNGGAVGAPTTHFDDAPGSAGTKFRRMCVSIWVDTRWGPGGPKTVLCACQNGTAPGDEFLDSVDPRELYPCAQGHSKKLLDGGRRDKLRNR